MCWKDHIPEIPLPCPDDCFESQLSSSPHYLLQIEGSGMHAAITELDLSSLMILVVRLRTKVMQYVLFSLPFYPLNSLISSHANAPL
jgi:hypothetical protein